MTDVYFDNTSGISIEEQQEVLSQIEGIAEKNRKRLIERGADAETVVIRPQKNSLTFPLIVNIAAVLLLCGGAFFLVSFNGKIDAQVRDGNNTINITERALIEEIRRDTADRIAEKELEINSISSRLEDVDAQLLQLYSSNIDLTAEQIALEQRLLQTQNSYRADLSALQDERSRILEESRSREARLRQEFAAAQARAQIEMDAAAAELEQLTREQERVRVIEAQFLGGLTAVSASIQDGNYDQARDGLENLNYFINSNLFSASRNLSANRVLYNQIVASMNTMVSMLSVSGSLEAGRENFELQSRNTSLESTITEMQRTIDAFSAGADGQTRRLAELEANASEKDRTINTLELEITSLQSANTSQTSEIANLRNQLDVIRQALLENND